jgi:hypothetical protein
MRFNQGIALCAFFLFITIAQCLSIHGFEHGLPHALRHVRKNIATNFGTLLPVNNNVAALSPVNNNVATNLEALTPVNKRDGAPSTVDIELVNNINSTNVHAYIQSTDGGSKEKVLITSEGRVYKPVASSKDVATPVPKSAKCGISLGPLGSTTTVTMPISLLTGRVYVADGELDIGALQVGGATELQHPSFANPHDPNFDTSFGFVEINQPDSTMWVNPTYVDFVGLPIAMEMVLKDHSLSVSGLPPNGVKQVCDLLQKEENKDGYPWSSLCLKDDDGKPFRVLSPEHKSGAFTNYFDDYINQVWSRFGTDGIVFDLQSNEPKVTCHMHGESMVCEGTSLPFPKPASSEIWGCNTGPFANTGDACHDHTGSRFCAAIHRGTLLLPGGAIQPNLSISKYYPGDAPHNKYARIVHEVQVDHTGYTFPYDDVKPDFNSEVSGTISGKNPSKLRIFVGGRDLGSGPQSSASFSSSTSSTSSSRSPSSTTSSPSSSTSSASISISTLFSSPSSSPSFATSTTPIQTTPGSSSATDVVKRCTEDDYCSTTTVTAPAIWTTPTGQESEETPSVDCEDSCIPDTSSTVEVVIGVETTTTTTTVAGQESEATPSVDSSSSSSSSSPDMATKGMGPAESEYVEVIEVIATATVESIVPQTTVVTGVFTSVETGFVTMVITSEATGTSYDQS